MAVEDSVPSQCTAAMFELLQEQSLLTIASYLSSITS